MRNLLIAAALVAVILFGVASRMRQEPPMVSVPDAGGAYVEALAGSPNSLNPILLQFNQADRDISALVFSGLTRFDENGLIVPDLAESWEITDGGKSYLFHLRRDVRWHDRTPFTSDDVVFTARALQATDFPGNADIGELWQNVGINQVDDFTVRFTLKEPFAPFLEYTTMGLLPRHLYADAVGKSMATSPYNLRPIGTGPFKLSKLTAEGATLEPNTDYYGAIPQLGQLRFRFYPDYAAAMAALERDEVDALAYLDPQDAARLQGSEKLAVYSVPDYQRYLELFVNNSNPVFKEKGVRQALASAINKEQIVNSALQGMGVAGKGPIPPGSWAFDPSVKGYEYDPQKSAALLEAAGWKDTNGDGVREKDGVSLSFVILTNDNKRKIKIAEAIVEDLRKVGFKSEVQAMPWTDLLKEYMASRTFLAVLAEQWLLTADPDVFSLWHSSQVADSGFNFAGMSNEKSDKLLEEARRTDDRGRRTQLYSEFQALWADEAPSVVLYYPKFSWAVNRNIKDVKLSALIDGSSRFRHVAQWYVKTKLVPQTQAR